MARQQNDKTIRVGLLVAVALIVAMVFLFFIGSENKVWARKQEYKVYFYDASGLAQGNPVKISGVTVGVIKDINLPRDAKQKDVEITLMVDKKYADRIRSDSRARLKKLGLLAGDSYVEITPGSPRFDALEAGSTIPAARQTNVDQLISSGEDLVDNFVQISYSLKNVLSRVDRGEGVLGELTSAPQTKQRLTDTVMQTLNKTNAILTHVESGKGVIGRLVYDDAYAQQLTGSLTETAQSMKTLVANLNESFNSGQGALPALLKDPEGKKKVYDLIDNLRVTSTNLATFSESLKNGQGLVPRLLNDKQYGDQALTEFTGLVHQLNDTVSKLNNGGGTASKLINDPSVYESINDILIGINESKMLRWLIRNRQQKGIETRVQVEQGRPEPPPTPATTTAPPPPAVPATTTALPPATAPPTDTRTGPAPNAAAPPATDTTSTAAAAKQPPPQR